MKKFHPVLSAGTAVPLGKCQYPSGAPLVSAVEQQVVLPGVTQSSGLSVGLLSSPRPTKPWFGTLVPLKSCR